MTNEEITDSLEITAKLMELHDANAFKAKAYAAAAFRLSKMRYDFSGRTKEDIESIEGVGKGIASKILELMETGAMADLTDMLEKTPPGVVDMLGIKGLGPKKVRQLWQELQLESVGELLYACNENRLLALKGFGEKTQLQVKQNIEFRQANSNKFHYATIEGSVNTFLDNVRKDHNGLQISAVGQVLRRCEVIDRIDILVGSTEVPDLSHYTQALPLSANFIFCPPGEFAYELVRNSSTPEHLDQIGFASLDNKNFDSDGALYAQLGMAYIVPELREGLGEVELARANTIPDLIQLSDLRGTIHNHSTWSDGVHSIREMADYCRDLGYQYLGICDHSRTAVYANGLSIERVIAQQQEIDKLNSEYQDFTILKGIESDILHDGSLDYPEEILGTFDFVVASVHSGLRMTEEKANARLIKAIENPYTSVLGHPTGRLLLSRNGYPIDHRLIIDACAANGVSIELNAHPYRLDIDWRWIPYCMEKGVMVSINPDAHHKAGIQDMYYGVCAARKGRLYAGACLNSFPLESFKKHIRKG